MRTTGNQLQLTLFTELVVAQGPPVCPTLRAIASFLDRMPELVDLIHADLIRGLARPDKGARAMSAKQVFRSMILAFIKGWTSRELRERIADGMYLREFVGYGTGRVPHHATFARAFTRVQPETIQDIVERIVRAAENEAKTDGRGGARYLRIDSTAVETNIHHPTDSSLMWDVVRKLTSLIRDLRKHCTVTVHEFPDRTRRVKKRLFDINELSRSKSADKKKRVPAKYQDMIEATAEVINAAKAVSARLESGSLVSRATNDALKDLRQEIEKFCQLGEHVVTQCIRRVLQGEKVPASEKLLSIFETHTDIIVRGKANIESEYGHKVIFSETKNRLIGYYDVPRGNPNDHALLDGVLQNHRRIFGEDPSELAADRGFFTEDNLTKLEGLGATPYIPRTGGKTQEQRDLELSPEFREANKWRAGIEGTISMLKRGRRMSRCYFRGEERFKTYVGCAVLANNLMRIAAMMLKSKKTRAA